MDIIFNYSDYLKTGLHEKFTLFGLSTDWSVFLIWCMFCIGILFFSFLCFGFARHYLLKAVQKVTQKYHLHALEIAQKHRVFQRLSYLVPAVIIYALLPLITDEALPFTLLFAQIFKTLLAIYMILLCAVVISSSLNGIEDRYQYFKISKQRPIKSYIQVLKMILFIFTAILVVSTLIGKSPMYLLTGLGAMTAILLLVFQDSIKGFVASIQLSAYDMVRIGDWIEVPSFGADGDVIDMSLNVIKVQNFDKTIVSVPSYALLTSGVKNWRGMSESGGRRIKRAISIDVNSVKFCDDAMIGHFLKIDVIKDLLTKKMSEINQYNEEKKADKSLAINGRNLTNLGVFRMYLEAYVVSNQNIHKGMTLLIRQLQAEGKGIPLELYIFTSTTSWREYEGIQSDIFDHIYAALPIFDLKLYQDLSGNQLRLEMTKTS
jgi:miniconductance mechanosensitive channel